MNEQENRRKLAENTARALARTMTPAEFSERLRKLNLEVRFILMIIEFATEDKRIELTGIGSNSRRITANERMSWIRSDIKQALQLTHKTFREKRVIR